MLSHFERPAQRGISDFDANITDLVEISAFDALRSGSCWMAGGIWSGAAWPSGRALEARCSAPFIYEASHAPFDRVHRK